ncbi:MAG TPA: NAD(P)-binding domain-containing protein [Rhizomicrobium sp.]|jgi:thioredoxin reductase|nr:NAD(P)-binding domain-containing protein [Rhizomicrobium sp.]
MRGSCDVAIIGAGPYGLSLAAHLNSFGISFRIFGRPLDTWRNHMPQDMRLKSEGFASNLSAPVPGSTLKAYCEARGIAYSDQGEPVKLDDFLSYAQWFRARFVSSLEDCTITSLEKSRDGYTLQTELGERFEAANVVMAVGITSFVHVPSKLRNLPLWAASHSFDHRDVSQFKDREVTVFGAGASAIDLADSLRTNGAHVQILARNDAIRYHSAPDPEDSSLLRQIQRPSSGIGPGWRSFFCANTPLLFHRMPESVRLRATRNHLGPAPGWFMRERVEGKIPAMLSHTLELAETHQGRVLLQVTDANGAEKALLTDHVIAATGYRPDLKRLPFLSPVLRERITQVLNTPVLSDQFETSQRGLYAMGPLAANSFGPLMRFMVGAEFAAPRVAAHLHKRLSASRKRAA